MERIIDSHKVDIALKPTSLATTNATGKYYSMAGFGRALFIFLAAAMAVGKTVIAQVMQAKDAAGTDAKVITAATATITANTYVKEATVILATFTAGNVIVINGLTFTAHATVTTVANREFSISGNDTADGDELATCINDPTYGVPGVVASNAAGTVTIKAVEPGETTITVVGVATIGVAATVEADGAVEVQATDLDINNGFTHVALKLTTDATIVVGASLTRGQAGETPVQHLAAITV